MERYIQNSRTIPLQLELTINEDGDYVFGTHMENLLGFWVSQGLDARRAALFNEVYKLDSNLDEIYSKSVNHTAFPCHLSGRQFSGSCPETYCEPTKYYSSMADRIFYNLDVWEELPAWCEVQDLSRIEISAVSPVVKRYFILVKELLEEKHRYNGGGSPFVPWNEINYQTKFKEYLERQKALTETRAYALGRVIRHNYKRPFLIKAAQTTSENVFPQKWVKELNRVFPPAGASDLESNPATPFGSRPGALNPFAAYKSNAAGRFGSFSTFSSTTR